MCAEGMWMQVSSQLRAPPTYTHPSPPPIFIASSPLKLFWGLWPLIEAPRPMASGFWARRVCLVRWWMGDHMALSWVLGREGAGRVGAFLLHLVLVHPGETSPPTLGSGEPQPEPLPGLRWGRACRSLATLGPL